MDKNTDKKNKVLGMSIGSATHRLRKIVLFDMLRRHNENVCYRCGKSIETVEELSLDHKQDWLNATNGRDLYWDVSNVSFSHLSCNSAARGGPERKHGTLHMYGKYKCRCTECVENRKQYRITVARLDSAS